MPAEEHTDRTHTGTVHRWEWDEAGVGRGGVWLEQWEENPGHGVPQLQGKTIFLLTPPSAESYFHPIKPCTHSPRSYVILFFQYTKARNPGYRKHSVLATTKSI